MKFICFISLMCISSITVLNSCKKPAGQELGSLKRELEEKKRTKEDAPLSDVGGTSSCSDSYLLSNFNAIRSAITSINSYTLTFPIELVYIDNSSITYHNVTIPISLSSQLNTLKLSLGQNRNTFENCRNGAPPPDPNMPEPVPVYNQEPSEVSTGVNASTALTYLSSTFINGKSYLEILKAAGSSVSLEYHGYERVAAMSIVIHGLGFGDMFNLQPVGHSAMYDPYLWVGLGIFSGLQVISSDIYNAFIADNFYNYVSFPSVHTIGGVKISNDVNHPILECPYVSVNINFNCSMRVYNSINAMTAEFTSSYDLPYYEPYLENLNVFYNNADQKLYSSNTFVSVIPDGFYRLPANYPNKAEKNNYIIQIAGGIIIKQFAPDGQVMDY